MSRLNAPMQTQSHVVRKHLPMIVAVTAIVALATFTFSPLAPHAIVQYEHLQTGTAKEELQPAAFLRASGPATIARLDKSYGKLSLSFEANAGQADKRVKFTARGKGYKLFLADSEAIVTLYTVTLDSKMKRQASPNLAAPEIANAVAKTATVHMKLLGANPDADVMGAEKLAGVSNYYIGNDPSKWRTGVPTYAKVRCTNVYPGVDLVYYANEGRLEHDFVVKPGADPAVIALQMEGAGQVDLTAEGDLRLQTEAGDVSLLSPTVYQITGDKRKKISASYVLSASNQVHFQLGNYNHAEALIIDPVLKYSTLLGGSEEEDGKAIAVDSAGEAYVTGMTNSADFPTKNPADSAHGYPWSAFVTKMNATGTGLIYSTYLGGIQGGRGTFGFGVAVDSAGAAYITGSTGDFDFPTKNAYHSSLGGFGDAFITKLSSTGKLVYSTFVGGAEYDAANAIAVDKSGKAYITGSTRGSFPTTANSLKTSSTQGIFVAALSASGMDLLYSVILGGTQQGGIGFGSGSTGLGIAVDNSGSAYVTGNTDFIPVVNAIQPKYGGQMDAFVTKISPAGDRLVYSTYLGGGGSDYGSGIAVDSSGEAYIAGTIESPDRPPAFPTTWNAFRRTPCGGYICGFITKLNANGGLLYSTFFGGSREDYINAIAVDQFGTAYVAGKTASVDFPAYASFRPPSNQNGYQGFVATLVPSGELGKSIHYYSAIFGSPLPAGASYPVDISAIAVDSSLNAYVTGYIGLGVIPITPGALQAVRRGTEDAFVSKLVIAADLGLANSASPASAVHGANLTYTLTTRNNGPDWAAYLKLDDPLPAGTTFVSYSAGGGACEAPAVGNTGTLRCTLPRLDAGTVWNVQLAVNVSASSGSSISNRAHIKSNMQDLVWQNNDATLTTAVH